MDRFGILASVWGILLFCQLSGRLFLYLFIAVKYLCYTGSKRLLYIAIGVAQCDEIFFLVFKTMQLNYPEGPL